MNNTQAIWLFTAAKRGKWETTADITFRTRFGNVTVPAGYETDLFSVVSNTEYPEFWLAAVLHDFVRENRKKLKWSIKMTDIVFRDEMTLQAFNIYTGLKTRLEPGTALDRLWDLLTRTRVYYKGVTGLLGKVWIMASAFRAKLT